MDFETLYYDLAAVMDERSAIIGRAETLLASARNTAWKDNPVMTEAVNAWFDNVEKSFEIKEEIL